MATRPEIPYYAPKETLPAPLPTLKEIRAVKKKDVLCRKVGNWTVRFGEHYVVKYGESPVHIQEGENLLFVRQATTIPVPTVYAIWKEGDCHVLVTEYVEGETLKDKWPRLQMNPRAAEIKEMVARQLRRYVHELRAIPSPGYYGGIWEQGVLDPILTFRPFVGEQIDPLVKKPSRSEEEWCEMMISAAENFMPSNNFSNAQWVRRKLSTMFSEGHEPKFTHCDIINRSNLMVSPNGVIVPVDWSMAGWYPSYWEYCYAESFAYDDDWSDWVSDMFEGMKYVPELGWFSNFRSWMGYRAFQYQH